jgi:FkbH-like protein
MKGNTAFSIATMLDELLEFGPALVRSRQVLPAIDWRNAGPVQVEKLVSQLDAAGMTVPHWLAFDLLAAGHTLRPTEPQNSSSDLSILSALNRPGVKPEEALELARRLQCAGPLDRFPVKIWKQIVDRLNDLGIAEQAIKLALSAYVAAPDALRPVRSLLDSYISKLPPVRLRVSGTSNTQTFVAALQYAFAAHDFGASVTDGGYASLMIELVQNRAPTDALILLLDQNYFMPRDWRRDHDQIRVDLEERLTALTQAMTQFCRCTGAAVVVNTLPPITTPSAGFADMATNGGAAYISAQVNQALASAAAANPQILLIDTAQALSTLPGPARHEPKLWYYGRIAYSEAAMRHIAWSVACLWRIRTRGPAKVLALDFDNTLWGGLFGDDGLENLQCGDDFPGSAYKAFQIECLRLKSQGMILVGLSKNNADALDAFDKHPGMVLRREDFVATCVNWHSKPENLRTIADELGLGLDAFLFLDDSPHEREEMRRLCPQVIAPEMPSDPAMRPEWLRSMPATWPIRITDADGQRTEYYTAEIKSRQLRETSGSYEEYLSGLAQRLTVQQVTPVSLPRIAQLHQRTNQFNLTNERLTEADLSRTADGPETRLVYSGSVRDRFGDLGLVVASAVDINSNTAVIRSLVMSCRVIGRQVERAFLSALVQQLQTDEVHIVVGLFKPTPKNAVAEHVYRDFGFEPTNGFEGFTAWKLSLKTWKAEPTHTIETIWSESRC